MKRGFYGIVIVEPKFDENIGTVFAFFTIGVAVIGYVTDL